MSALLIHLGQNSSHFIINNNYYNLYNNKNNNIIPKKMDQGGEIGHLLVIYYVFNSIE